MRIQRQRGTSVEWIGARDRLRPGDAIRVIVTLARPSEVSLWFLDRAGRVDALLDGPMRLAAGESVLPGSAVVESPCREGLLVLATGDRRAHDHIADRLRRSKQVPSGVISIVLGCE